MHWIDRMNLGQRIIVVISFGMALAVAGSYIVNSGNVGWFGYAPLTGAIYEPGPSSAVRLVVWFVLIAIWALASVVVLRSPKARGGSR
jgi:heme/copper-type cytochrome/quinol oxidase subunit 1